MEIILFSIAVVIIMLITFFFFTFDEDSAKLLLFGTLVCVAIFSGIHTYLKHPPASNYYTMTVADKVVRTRTETYKCGESTCTRIIYEYYLIGKFDTQEECEEKVSHSDYNTAKIGGTFTCSASKPNYMALDSDRFKTTESIRNEYKKTVKDRYDYSLFKQKYVYGGGNLPDLTQYNEFIKQSIKDKPYIIQVILTKQDRNWQYMLNEKWEGAKPSEIILIYGLGDDANKIEWSKMITYAENDENEMLAADFETRHLQRQSFNEVFFDDIKFVQERYKNVNSEKHQEMSEMYNTAGVNWAFAIILGLYIAFCLCFFIIPSRHHRLGW